MIILFLQITFNIILVSGNVIESFILYSAAVLSLLNFVTLMDSPVFILIWCVVFVDTFSTGSTLSDQVYQTPAHMYSKPGEQANISCSHSIQDYTQILWYKQSMNKLLQFLGHMNVNDGYPEDGVNVKARPAH